MKKTMWLFRTGEVITGENIFLGWINLPLNKKGIQESKQVAQKLKNEKIDIAFCSDQIRAEQALSEVLSFHKNAKVIIDHRIRERNYGIFSGHSKELFKEYYSEKHDEIKQGYLSHIPKGENFEELSKRVFPFIREMLYLMEQEKKNVLICAHTNSMKVIDAYFENISDEEISKIKTSPTEIKRYDINFMD